MGSKAITQNNDRYDRPFQIEDLQAFDDNALRALLAEESSGVTVELMAQAIQGATNTLAWRIEGNVPQHQHSFFLKEYYSPTSPYKVDCARREVLNNLFWELTYWKTPELYEELTEGEHLHPGIFQHLRAELSGRTVLDAGAGSGRATFECLTSGADRIYAVEPSPGLLHILERKLLQYPEAERIVPHSGRFNAIPLPDNSVDVALSCSAFTSTAHQGGEAGLAELRRVTRYGGKIIVIWPRTEDHDWLVEHGFHYVTLPVQQEMSVRFRSVSSALRCARRFYPENSALAQYILTQENPEVPFSVIGLNPPRDYCWVDVMK